MRISADDERVCGPEPDEAPSNVCTTVKITLRDANSAETSSADKGKLVNGSAENTASTEKAAITVPKQVSAKAAMAEGVPNPNTCSCVKICSSCYNEMKEDLKKEVVEEVLKCLPSEKTDVKKVRTTSEGIREVVHHGVFCDSCDQEICGIRYKCGNCDDFDLCEKCENSDIYMKHDKRHIFLKIRDPSCFFTLKEGVKKKIYQVPLASMTADEKETEPDNAKRPKPQPDVMNDRVKAAILAKEQRMTLDDTSDEAKSLDPWDVKEYWARCLPDDTIPDVIRVAPGQKFTKTWRMLNSGRNPWTYETVFHLLWSYQGLKPLRTYIPAPQLKFQQQGFVSVMFTAPVTEGHYESYWEFRHLGRPMGDTFWCRIRVDSTKPMVDNESIVSTISAVRNMKSHHQQIFMNHKRKVKEEKRKRKENRKKDAKQIVDALNAVHEKTHCPTLKQRLLAIASSQTATPNNTPLDIDKTSPATLSSSDSESEFVVIPMPKCFSLLQSYPSMIVETETSVAGAAVEKSTTKVSSDLSQTVTSVRRQISQETGVPEDNVTIQSFSEASEKPLISMSSSSVSLATGGQNTDEETKTEELTSGPPLIEPMSGEPLEASAYTFPKFPVSVEQLMSDVVPSAPDATTYSSTMEGPIQVLPKGLVNGALLAAATVYNRARAVMSTLQPVLNEGDQSHCIPTQMTPGELLVEMGFCNRGLNEMLLNKHSGDIARVVAELVNLNDNEWYAARHAAN